MQFVNRIYMSFNLVSIPRLKYLMIVIVSFQQSFLFSQKTIHIKKSSQVRYELPKKLKETSGSIFWNNSLWTHNDDNDNSIYGINTTTGNIDSVITFKQLKVVDWEELQQDDLHFYIGDFGNNLNGNRSDLRIFIISKQTHEMDTIHFSYPENIETTPQKQNTSNFDCEAFLVTDSMIYLFTKEWTNKKTSLYKLPNQAGSHKAVLVSTFKSKGLITGSAFSANKQLIALTAYSRTLKPYVYLLSDYTADNFLKGKQLRLKLKKRFLQIESVSFISSFKIAVTNERFKRSFINSPQQLIIIDLTELLQRFN